MATRIPTGSRNAAVDAITARVGTSGLLRIYTGSQPATADTAASGTLLAEVTLPATAFGAASNGTATLNDPGSVNGVAAGTAGWFRIVNAAGTTTVLDGSVTATGGGGDLTLSNTSIAVGQTVDISAGGTVTMPGG